MKLDTGKEMDRYCVFGWLNEVYHHPKVAFSTYSDKQQIEFAHDALVLLKEQPQIVRCMDCKYYHKPEYGFTLGDCTRRTSWYSVKEKDFCSLACKKDGDVDGNH